MPVAHAMKVTPAHQAERILAAWAAGDEPLLHSELQNSRELSGAARGLDEERLELLQAVSEGMLRTPAGIRDRQSDPSLRRCLDLLAHLAKNHTNQ